MTPPIAPSQRPQSTAPADPHPALRRTLRAARASAAGALALVALVAAGPARAEAAGIQVQSAFAGPIAASNAQCTAEPRALIYGTTNYDPSRPLDYTSVGVPTFGYWEPANAPSTLDLIPALQAGGRADLCAGFTLPPDAEPGVIRDYQNGLPRVQDDPAWPDVPETHVVPATTGAPVPVGDDLQDLAIDLPAGYQANFAAAPACSAADFAATSYVASTCPTASQVGTAFVRVTGWKGSAVYHGAANGIKLYNLGHGADEFARLGLAFSGSSTVAPTKLVLRVVFAGDASGRLELVAEDIPRTNYLVTDIAKEGTQWAPGDVLDEADPRIGQPIPTAVQRQLYIEGMSVRLWGNAADHPTLAADLGSWGSACSAALTGAASATTYGGNASAITSPSFSLAGCSGLSLPAAASVDVTDHAADAPTGATITLDLPQGSDALATALPRAIDIALPAGLELGPQIGAVDGGATLCSATQFGSTSVRTASACPATSLVGSARITTALTGEAFVGTVALGVAPDTADGTRASVFIDAAIPGATAADAPRIKLAGRLEVAADGTTTFVFDDVPAIRMTQLRLTLDAGATALLTTPATCGTHSGTTTLAAGGFGPQTAAGAAITIDRDCAPAPTATLALSSSTPASSAIGRDATSFTLSRPASGAPMTGISVALPAGVLVAQTAVPSCDAAAAQTGDCPAESRIGAARLELGAGDRTATVNGSIYLTSAPDAAASGAVIVADARLGDLHLGRVIAPARFDVRPGDAGTTLSATLPTRVDGTRLDLQALSVDLDRDGAVLPPTACGPLSAVATVETSAGQATTNGSSAVYASCGSRAFDPTFSAQLTPDATGTHVKASLSLTPRAGDAALRSVTATLPTGFTFDTKSSATQCSPDAFNAGACPASSSVGQASGRVSVSPDVFGGTLHLVQVPGRSLPGVGITFSGRYGYRTLGLLGIDAAGRLALSFPALPDLPLTRLALAIDGGAAGVIKTVAASCDKAPAVTADLVAQGGQTAARSAAVACSSALGTTKATGLPHIEFSMSAKTGLKLKMNAFGGRQLQTAKLTLPKALRFKPAVVKRKGNTAIVLIGAKAKPSYSSGSLTMWLTGGPAQEVVARIRTAGYVIKPSATGKKAKAQSFRLRLSYADGTVQTTTVSAKLR